MMDGTTVINGDQAEPASKNNGSVNSAASLGTGDGAANSLEQPSVQSGAVGAPERKPRQRKFRPESEREPAVEPQGASRTSSESEPPREVPPTAQTTPMEPAAGRTAPTLAQTPLRSQHNAKKGTGNTQGLNQELPCEPDNVLCIELRAVSRDVRPHDGPMADRLSSLSKATIKNQPTDGWESVNLFDAVNPDRLANVIRTRPLRSKGIGLLELSRNVLVLVPIMLTWFSLWVALKAYANTIEQRPEFADEPFLMLWQSGFHGVGDVRGLAKLLTFGQPEWLTLGHVAALDALLIALIVIMTLIIHWQINVRQASRELEILSLDRRLRTALWEASRLISRSTTPAGQYDKLYKMAQQLVDQIAAERDRIGQIATERENALTDFSAGMQAFQEGTGEISKGAERVANSMAELQNALNSTIERDRQLVKGLEDFSQTGQRQNELLVEQNRKIDASSKTLNDAAQVLTRAAIESHKSSNTIADKLEIINKKIIESQHGERETHNKQREMVELTTRAATALERVADNAIKGAQRFEESVKSLQSISLDAQPLRDTMTRAGKQMEESANSLMTMSGHMPATVRTVEAAGQSLSNAAQEIAATVAQAQRETEQREGLVGRLRRKRRG